VTIWSVIPLATSVAYAVLLISVIPSARRRANRVFALFLAIAGTWSFTSFMLHLNAVPAQALFWNNVLVLALASTLVAYYHFIRAYTDRPAGAGIVIGYSIVAILATFSFRGDVIKSATVERGILTNEYGLGVYLLGAVSVAFIAAVIVNLVKKYRTSRDPADRNRTMYLMVGWTIMFLLTYTNFIPAVSGLPLDHAGSLLNAAIITYAVTRLHLLDVRVILRRGLAMSILGVILIVVSVGPIFVLQAFSPGDKTYALLIIVPALVFIIAIMGRPLIRISQIAVDRMFYGETYSYREELLGFSTRAGNIIDLEQLAGDLLPSVIKALRITQARLMFQQNGGGNFTTQFFYPKEHKEDALSFSIDNPIIALLQKENDPIDLKQIDALPQLKGLWLVDRERIATSEVEFLHPIKSRGRLIGILALGKKRSNGLYLSEDIELIKSMASQAGIIIDNARVHAEAVTWAHTDGLTELYNHRHFHERLDQEIARGSRFGSVFSLVMLDLDHFKQFNDNYGHLTGDDVLRRVGQCIQSSIRSIDMAFRYGGEEFTVILPGTKLGDAFKAAERIRNTIEAKASPGTVPVTASLGVSTWPIDGMTKQDIIGRADAALYQAKQAGRNKVFLSTEVVKGQTSVIGRELATKERAVSIIYALAATVDAKDHYTYGHSKKVSQYAVVLAEAIGLGADRVDIIRAAGLLHDIGKIAVPDSVLNKAGPLTAEEWAPMKAHPELGMEILKHVIDLVNCLPGILHHHEHYDGSGYPGALKGEEIPFEARVLAIADAYDAITSMRPYHNQLTSQEAIAELRRCSKTQFDPALVEKFCQTIESTLPKHADAE
jgi:diguanylate cyclase (GGDEF)-like protein/putative nucleotidyltransferase with HDIG domain